MQKENNNHIFIPYYRIQVGIEFTTPLNLHFPEALFRGALGYTLHSLVCVQKKTSCENCFLAKTCVFFALFYEDSQEYKSSLLHNNKSTPKPYIIRYFPETETKGKLDFIFFNKLEPYINHLVFAVMKMAENGIGQNKINFKITSIKDNCIVEIYDKIKGLIKEPARHEFKYEMNNTHFNRQMFSAEINFIKPVKIIRNNKLLRTISFKDFSKALLLRVSYLSQLFGEYELTDEYIKNINKLSVSPLVISEHYNLQNYKRFSTHYNEKMEFIGLVGKVAYKNIDPVFYKLLEAGSIFGIGKNTTFGFGFFELMLGQSN